MAASNADAKEDVSPESGPFSSQFPLPRPSIGPAAKINPFTTSFNNGTLETIKTVLMLPIFVLRVILLVLLMLIAYVSVKIALIGVIDPLYKPFPTWRRVLLVPIRLCARGCLFCFGFMWIKVKGKPATREQAPIIVSNHISFIDPVFIFYRHLPVIVSAKENLEIPIVGVYLQALQIIPVDRVSPTSRRDAAVQIKRRAIDNAWPHIMLFPEGTTTNGRAVVSFKTGAFAPGLPVQPMAISYPNQSVSTAWVDRNPLYIVFRLMTQIINYMEVEYLAVVEPTLKELKDPHGYAERVREQVAKSLNVSCTDHTFSDVKLATAAAKLNVPVGRSMVEFGKMEKLFHLDLETAKQYLEKFSDMDVTHSGLLTVEEFLEALDLPLTPFTMRAFHLFDTSEKGYINFREFVAGLAFISKHTSFAQAMMAAFHACDVDGSGHLSKSEVERSIQSIFPHFPPEKIDNLFQTLDMDQNGLIDWQEFRQFLQRNPEYLVVIMSARPDFLQDPACDLTHI
eukprot:TRINITY_DN15706_c0_g1_i1.p1 TRINITY_DN15706_c0_g1~~TRINITY_DN15706_c0_g1_i1.p1  ORF type:complete len:511 (-),score=73.70 TRINITY_DN15706_c0_g1_i1:249-1781(-)